MINIKAGAIAKLNFWHRECREDLIGVLHSDSGVERGQMTAAAESTSHFKTFRLLNMEGSGARIRDSEAVIVILVFVDIIIREIGDSNIEAANISMGMEFRIFAGVLTWEG